MMQNSSITIQNDVLELSASYSIYDSASLPFPVATINSFSLKDETLAIRYFNEYEEWRDARGFGLVSCRLTHDKLRESMFLEGFGFRFIEMVLKPHFKFPRDLQPLSTTGELNIALALNTDLMQLRDIAERAFGYERFHVDFRLKKIWGNVRYGKWIENTQNSPAQKLVKLERNGAIVGFFIYEQTDNEKIYWHLTALDPDFSGKGLGRQAWLAMMAYHHRQGCREINTTISARNSRVLGLYSSLNFRYLPPEMTFHWIRPQ